MFKNRCYIENVLVNSADDENYIENIVRRLPLKFLILVWMMTFLQKFSRKIFKQESFNTSKIATPSHSITINVDSVVKFKQD